ncbi:MAG: tetratricopeptide repeat protein [Pirellulaceae bacterium]
MGKIPAGDSPSSSPRRGWLSKKWTPLIVVGLVLAIGVEAYWVYGWFRVQWLIDQAHERADLMDYPGAEQLLLQADALRPQSPNIYLELAALRRLTGNTREFESWIENAESAGASEEDVLREILLMRTQVGHIDSETEEFQKLLAVGELSDRYAAEVYYAMVKGYLASYQVLRAEDAVNSWLNWRPDSVQARFLRGNIRYRFGQIDQAITDYRFVLEHSPDNAEAHLLLGLLLNESGRVEEAYEHFDRSLELQPDSAETQLELAYCAKQLGYEERAKELAEALLKTDDPPRRAKAMELLAKLAIEGEEYERARELLEQAFRTAPPNGELCHMMGTVLSLTGDTERAQVFMDQAAGFRDRHDRIQDLTKQLIDEPDRDDLRLEVAELMFRDGQEEPGAMWLLTILKNNPDHLPSHRLLAAYYQRIGQPQVAAVHRKKAAELAEAADSTSSGGEGSDGS